MWDPFAKSGAAPRFWPPRPSRFWTAVLEPVRRRCLHGWFGITQVDVAGFGDAWRRIAPGDGVLIAPNHSHDSDPHVMLEVGHQVRRRFYFMAAWQVFCGHRGLDGWAMQRIGAFSVDRESYDRHAVKQAVELLTSGRSLVVFPEGEVFHMNDRITPLLEGVAFMALSAQRELEQASAPARVWIVPTAIRYRYVEDISARLEDAVAALEARVLVKPRPAVSLPERIVHLGEVQLTIKDKEVLGQARDHEGDLPTRIAYLVAAALKGLETEHLRKSPAAETIPLRIKALRRHLLQAWIDEKGSPETRRAAREALEDVQLVLRLFSYPGDYITAKPSVERMAETVEKFEEDIYGDSRPKGKRRARVLIGEPIDLKEKLTAGPTRAVTADVTAQLEHAIQRLIDTD